MKTYKVGILAVLALLLTACSPNLWAAAPSSQNEDAGLEWAFTRADQHPEQVLIGVIDEAITTLDVAIYSLTHPQIVSALQRAEKRGVAVRIIADQEQAQGKAMTAALQLLGSSGAEIKINSHSGLMHLKMVVADQTTATTGSFNFSKAAASVNDEILMVIRDADVSRSFAIEFESMWNDTGHFQTIHPEIAATGSVPVPSAEGDDQPVSFCSEAAAQAAGYRKSKS